MPRRFTLLSIMLLAASLATAPPTHASDDEHDEHERRDKLRGAVARGEVMSLADVLKTVSPRLGGEIVGVEIESGKRGWLYEFTYVDSKGRIFEAYVDAATAQIMKIEAK